MDSVLVLGCLSITGLILRCLSMQACWDVDNGEWVRTYVGGCEGSFEME